MTASFIPRQVIPVTSDVLFEFLGTCTENIALEIISKHPSFPSGAVIHDNGCGAGAITQAIMATHPPETIHIKATDTNSSVISILETRASTASWPVEAVVMDSTALAFPNEYFSHSFLNFVMLQAWRSDLAIASEIYRTLSLGAVAVLTTFEELSTMTIFRTAYKQLRGKDCEEPDIMHAHYYGGSEIRQALIKAGFNEYGIRIEHTSTRVRIRNVRRWCEIGWSMSGACPTGWQVKDEETWNEAIDVTEKIFRSGVWWKADDDGDGEGWMEMVASVLYATK